MEIKLKPNKSQRFVGTFRYLISYDYAAERRNRYTLLILNADDPVTAGRELPISEIKNLIRDYEEMAQSKKLVYMGDRHDVIKCVEAVSRKRRGY